MLDNDSDDEQEDLLGNMSDLEKLKLAFKKRKWLCFDNNTIAL